MGLLRVGFLPGLALFLTSMLASTATTDLLESILEEESLPGVAWATVYEGRAQAGGKGYAELDSARLMTATTKVQVGSITKTLVALGILRLVSDDQLDLDANVEQLLPMLHWENPWRAETPVTVRHLLEHTAGLDNIRMWQFLNTGVTADTPLIDAFPDDVVPADHDEVEFVSALFEERVKRFDPGVVQHFDSGLLHVLGVGA